MKIARVLFISYTLTLFLQFIIFLFLREKMDPTYQLAFTDFSFSDFLINYEAGFIRRGLIGEMLLYAYSNWGINIGNTILWSCIISTIMLIALVIFLFKKKGLSFFILPTVVLLGGFAMNRLTLYRRDAIMLLLIFAAIYFYRCTLYNRDFRRITNYFLFNLFCTLTILIHEASFFCFVPFLFLHHITITKNSDILKSISRTLIFFLPAVLTITATVIFKGDERSAYEIWNSWTPYFMENYGQTLPMGQGVEALSWNSSTTFEFHLRTNYLEPIINHVPRVFAWCIIFFFTFYLCVNVNRIKLFNYEKKVNQNFLTTTLLITFISLLPMFTVLSCDLRRVTIYWTITSFFIYALLEDTLPTQTTTFVSCCVEKINRFFENSKILKSKLFYVIVALTIICPFAAFPMPKALFTSVLGNIYSLIKTFLSLA